MRRFDERVRDRIQSHVEDIERDSAAEVVVKIVPMAGHYGDVAWRVGAIAAFAALGVVLFAERVFTPVAAMAVVVAAGLVGHTLGARWPALIRFMTSDHRGHAAVADAARLAFHDEAVDATAARTGVLVFVAALEARIVVVPDRPLRGLAPDAAWGRLDVVGASGEELGARLEAVLKELGALVRSVAPRRDDDTDELPDAPRIG